MADDTAGQQQTENLAPRYDKCVSCGGDYVEDKWINSLTSLHKNDKKYVPSKRNLIYCYALKLKFKFKFKATTYLG